MKVRGKTKMETKQINKTNVMNLTDEEREEFKEEVDKLFSENRNLYTDASELVNQLGLGGLWRGIDASIVLVARAMKKREVFK